MSMLNAQETRFIRELLLSLTDNPRELERNPLRAWRGRRRATCFLRETIVLCRRATCHKEEKNVHMHTKDYLSKKRENTHTIHVSIV
jgi:hypothetical protein